MHVFITGISGLLGTHLVARLLQSGHSVHALVRSDASRTKALFNLKTYAGLGNTEFLPLEFTIGGLCEPHTYLDALDRADAMVHAAGLVSFDPKRRNELYETNVKATADLVNACLEVSLPYLVHISSVAALCSKNSMEISSETPFGPPSGEKNSYATSKYLGELEVWRGIQEGLNASILNPSVILGFHDWKHGSSAMFHRAYRGLNFYTHGATGFVMVSDVVEAVVSCLNKKITEERFIISAENIAFRSIFNTMAEAFGKEPARYYAGPLVTGMYRAAESVLSSISGRYPLITKESARSAHAVRKYSNEKSCDLLGLSYTPVLPAIQETCKKYMEFNQ